MAKDEAFCHRCWIVIVLAMGMTPVMTKAQDPEWSDVNLTVWMHNKQMECTHMYLNQSFPGIDPDFHCTPNFDGLVCWPPTAPGERATLPCPIMADEYQTTQAQRTCLPTGDWIIQDLQAVYGEGGDCRCVHCEHMYILSTVGYALSFTACAIAFLIFFCSRTLHCTRNRIHWHLISSFMLKYMMYFIQPALLNVHSVHSKRIVQFLLYYFEQTNYFWMFVEGLYLHTLVVFALRIDADKISFLVYCIIGWGIPLIFVGVYATVSAVLYPESDFVDNGNSVAHEYACIIGPILIVLVVNCFFLLNIVRLLMSKLRMHGSRSSDIKHYRRAARATLVLVVLLGVGYVLMLCLPILGTNLPRMGYLVFKYINSLLSGTQGLAVAVIYVFLNTEVRTVLRRKWRRRFGNSRPSCLCRRRAKARTSSYSKYDDQTCVSTMRSLAQNDTVLDSCYQEDEPGHNRGQQLRSAPHKSPGGVVVVVANGDTPKKEKPQKLEMKEVKTNGNVVTWDKNPEDKGQEEAEPLLEDGVNPPKPSATIVISEATPEHTKSDDAAVTD